MAIGKPKTMTRVGCFILLLCFGWVDAIAQPPSQKQDTPKQDTPFSPTVPVQEGDRCIVCGTPLSPGDKVYLVEGQRVGVMTEMEAEGPLLTEMEPRSATSGPTSRVLSPAAVCSVVRRRARAGFQTSGCSPACI